MQLGATTSRCRTCRWLAMMTLAAAAGCAATESAPLGARSGRATAVDDVDQAAYAASGATLYAQFCAACHGERGAGRKGLGKTLAQSAFVQSLDDEALLAFIKRGRYPSDPENTTGVGMPPRGGSPSLVEDDLLDIIAYLRTLQKGGESAHDDD